MAEIRPFSAIIYNQEKIKNLSKVVCPPYDIISPEAQARYCDLSPYNFIHILLGKDVPGEDKYQRAASCFKDWLKNKILIQDKVPAIYFYSQQYKIKGETRTRLGFIALLRLSDKGPGVFGHENTHLAPKEDRLRLLKEVKANLSPIFAIFTDKKRIIRAIYQQYIHEGSAFINLVDDDNIIHKLWRLDDAEILAKVREALGNEDIFIADGHHRYEVACSYRDQMRQELGGNITGQESFNYALVYFTNTDPQGLTIFPIHRLVRLDSPTDTKKLLISIGNYFDVEEVKEKRQFFFLMEKCGCTEHVLGMYKDKKYWLLRLKNIKILDKIISDRPKEYRSLDVSILNYMIFKDVLKLDLDRDDLISFSPNPDDFIREVDDNPLCVAFFLNPVKIQQIISVALNGNKMPPKSTYFYPKVMSGLVINKFEDT